MNTSTRQPLRDRQLLVKNQVNRKCFSWRILIENIKWFVVDFIFLKHLLQPEIQSYIVLRDGCTDLVKKVSKDFIWLCFVSSQYSCISGSLTLAFYYSVILGSHSLWKHSCFSFFFVFVHLKSLSKGIAACMWL